MKKQNMKHKFTKETMLHILRGAGIAGGGAFSIYFLQAIGDVDFGELTPMVVAIASILINAVREWTKNR